MTPSDESRRDVMATLARFEAEQLEREEEEDELVERMKRLAAGTCVQPPVLGSFVMRAHQQRVS